ncbi:uncharacterized protein [Ptychodera flava]
MYIEDRGGWLPVLYYLATISGPRETWTSTAANILCRELGYKGAASHGYDRGALARDQRLRISIVRCDEEFRTLFNCSYTFQPQNTFTAAATANCSSVTPSVTPPLINCGDPGQVENANRTGTVYSYNSSVKYMCLDGYNINGDDVIRCTLDGTWSAKPVCIEHGSVTEPSSGIGLIIGIAVGIVAVTVGVFAVVFFICRRERKVKGRHLREISHGTNREGDTLNAFEDETWGDAMAYEEIPELSRAPDQAEMHHRGGNERHDRVKDSLSGPSDENKGPRERRALHDGPNKSAYQDLVPGTRGEHLYTGLSHNDDYQDGDDEIRTDNESPTKRAYTSLDPSLMSDKSYCRLVNSRNTGDNNMVHGDTPSGTTYEPLRPELKSEQTYTGLR